MKQDKISEITKKAIETPMKLTQSLMEKTEMVKTPSPSVDKTGRSIGVCVGTVLLLTGCVGLIFSKSLWPIGTSSVGAVTLISNLIGLGKYKKQK